MFERLRPRGRSVREEFRHRAMGPQHHELMLRGRPRGQRSIGKTHQPIHRARHGQQVLLHRRHVEDVEPRDSLRLAVPFRCRDGVEIRIDGQGLIEPPHVRRHQAQPQQTVLLQAVRPVGKHRPLHLFQQAIRDPVVPSGVLDVRCFEHPGSCLQDRIRDGSGDFQNALKLSACLLRSPKRKQEIAKIAACQDFTLGMSRLAEPVRRTQVESARPLHVSCAIDVAERHRQPEVLRMRRDQTLERPSAVVPQLQLANDQDKAVRRFVVVWSIRESLTTVGKRVRGRRSAGRRRPCCRGAQNATEGRRTIAIGTPWNPPVSFQPSVLTHLPSADFQDWQNPGPG